MIRVRIYRKRIIKLQIRQEIALLSKSILTIIQKKISLEMCHFCCIIVTEKSNSLSYESQLKSL